MARSRELGFAPFLSSPPPPIRFLRKGKEKASQHQHKRLVERRDETDPKVKRVGPLEEALFLQEAALYCIGRSSLSSRPLPPSRKFLSCPGYCEVVLFIVLELLECLGTSIQLGPLNRRGRIFLALFVTMDNGVDLPIPSHLPLSHPEISHGLDDFLKSTTACTHTHTCNPPGPAAAMHTHTCLHTHTQVIASGEEQRKPQKPLGNREAVRKYREKKKAHAAFLEEEVKKLRATNQQLLRRLQGHAALEAEVVRLRVLLFDVRGKIDAEIDSFPFQKHSSVDSVICTDPPLCFNTNAEVAARETSSGGPTILDFEIDESGSVSRELDIPEVVNSMDAAASYF